MLIPRYWAEARLQDRTGGRQITVRRFGWSNLNQADAEAKANQRAQEALAALRAGAKVPRRERKLAYGGEGLPIREEIVREIGDTVLSRNSYGALCLNSPNVLFADVDFPTGPSGWLMLGVLIVLWGIAAAFGIQFRSAWVFGIGAFAALFLFSLFAEGLHHAGNWLSGGAERRTRQRLERFLASRPDWHLRLYRTPAGLRLLAMHATFDPSEPVVSEFFRSIQADPQYVRMCLRQHCFRARVTAKPWRIGIKKRMKPSPGVWPVAAERLPERQQWVAEYEAAAKNYAACHFVETLGLGASHPAATAVQRLHDQLCQAESNLPLA